MNHRVQLLLRVAALALVASLLVSCHDTDSAPRPDVDVVGGRDTTDLDAEVPRAEIQPRDLEHLPDTPPVDIRQDTAPDREPVPDPHQELITHGKNLLAAGEPLAAGDVFYQVLLHRPDHLEALFGASLAQLQNWLGLFDSLLHIPTRTEDPDEVAVKMRALKSRPYKGSPPSVFESGVVGATIKQLRIECDEQIERLEKLLELTRGGEFVFHLDSLPLAMDGALRLDLCCEWRRADLHSMTGLTKLLRALLVLLESQDIDVDLRALQRALDIPGGLVRMITGVLLNEEDLFALAGETGAARYLEAHGELMASTQHILRAAELLEREADSPAMLDSRVARLTTQGTVSALSLASLAGDERRPLRLLWDSPGISLAETIRQIAAHLDGHPDLLRLDHEVAIVLGVILDIVHKTIGIPDFIGILGVELPSFIGGLLQSLRPDSVDALPRLIPLILDFVGLPEGSVALDLNTFLSRPTGLRDLLPNMAPCPIDGEADFMRSYECLRFGHRESNGPWQAGSELRATLHDPLAATEDEIGQLELTSFAADSGVPVDTLHLPAAAPDHSWLTPVAEIEGLYHLSIPTTADGEAGAGLLLVPPGGSVTAHYSRQVDDQTVATMLRFEEGDSGTLFAMALDCRPEAAFDGEHFYQREFESAREWVDDGWGPVSIAYRDGVISTEAHYAFKQPSFNGLLWLDMQRLNAPAETEFPVGLALSDQSMINRLLQRVLDAIDLL